MAHCEPVVPTVNCEDDVSSVEISLDSSEGTSEEDGDCVIWSAAMLADGVMVDSPSTST